METETKPLLSDATYNRLKFIALVILPALGTLYFALAQIWGLPKAEEVVGTIVALDTFLGLLIKKADSQYNKSDAKYDAAVVVTEGPHGPVYALQFETVEQHLAAQSKDALLIKVK